MNLENGFMKETTFKGKEKNQILHFELIKESSKTFVLEFLGMVVSHS